MPVSSSDHELFTFGQFTLDIDRGTLLRSGVELKLRPKSYEVLRFLVAHPGRLIDKHELLDAVWGHVIVTDGSITQCLIDIRRALDEGLACSSSEKGPLRIAFPHKVLDAWFPQLFTDLPVQEP